MQVEVVLLDPELGLPAYARPGDAGMDLRSRVDAVVGPGERVVVPTGVSLALPDGFAGFVHPRSGLASRQGLTVVNAPGTIDAGFRGEVCVALVNLDRESTVEVCRGDRVAQLVVQRVSRVVWVPVDALDESVRGDGGFGSSGVSS